MALQMEVGGAAYDMVANRVTKIRWAVGYSHPARLTFTLRQAQHTTPIPAYASVKLWDDAALDAGGLAFTTDNPLFYGTAEEIQPGPGSNELQYTCYDITARVASETQVYSDAWASATTVGAGTVPRLLFNAAIDNDDDWVFCRGFNLTVGQMVAVLLDDPLLRLRAFGAAPAADTAYESTDLTGMDFIPQEKVVFTGEPLRSAVMRLIDDWEPNWRMLWNPGSQKWRFGNIGLSPQVTYTLNDFSGSHPVLKLQMDRSLENRFTAVRIYGPEALQNVTVTLSGGGLTALSGGPILDTYGGTIQVIGQSQWQITDTTKRRMGRMLPTAINAPLEQVRIGPNAWHQQSVWTRTPSLQVRYKNNNAGTDAWQQMTGWWYDPATGILDFNGNYVYRYNPYPQVEGAVLQPEYENPEDVQLVYPSYIEALQVRKPAAAAIPPWEGTAYSVHGLENELAIYDESLAVGFLFGQPVTSATRKAKFEVLAQKILDSKKDVLYHGGMTLEGIDYAFHRLDRRVNIAGVDGDGVAKTTGWEAIKAIVTDCEYDFEEMLTTVQFNSDHSELLGFDAERIKQELKVGAEFISQIVTSYAVMGYHWAHTEWGTRYLAQSMTVGGSVTPVIVDPWFGTVDRVETS